MAGNVDVVGIGSCTVDYFAIVPRLLGAEEKINAERLEIHAGGVTANNLTQVARLGASDLVSLGAAALLPALYVVVAAIMVALLYGSWWARVAAAADLAILVFIGQIFAGLSTLQVAAVGHATALVVGAAGGGLLRWQRRRTARTPRTQPAGPQPLG